MPTSVDAGASLRGDGAAVVIDGAPRLAGLVVRHWRDEADLRAYVDVVNGSWIADGIVIRTSVPNEAAELRHLSGFDIAADLLLVELEGNAVGFARVDADVDDEGVSRHWITIMLTPAGRGLGLESPLLAWCEGRHRDRAAGGVAGVARRLGAWAAEREPWWTGLLERSGYRPVRYFCDMVRDDLDDLPDRSLPPGLEVRPVAPDGLRAVIAAKEEAFMDHWGHHMVTEDDIVGLIEHPHTDPSMWVVAWDGDEIAGLVMGSVMHDENASFGWRRGWLGAVATRRAWRGRGLASALMIRALSIMRERGLTSAALGVDTENPHGALGLYERLGFRTDQRFLILFKEWEST